MSSKVVCEICGGTEFHNEDGYYYCNECQTQTQELREQVYEHLEATVDAGRTRINAVRVPKTKIKQKQNKITSWETCNYILAGLVKELIGLGANEELKNVTYHLWMEYLTKLEVLPTSVDQTPKLSARYKRRDLEIIYGPRPKKKNKQESNTDVSFENTTQLNELQMKRERRKRQRALIDAEYEEQKADVSETLHNQTLESLIMEDQDSKTNCIQFSAAARQELLKIMSKSHIKKHAADINEELTCHKIKNLISQQYCTSPLVLSRNKLYAILYLGLLLTNDKLQASDLIRMCRSGHMSYLDYKHFYPEELSSEDVDESITSRGSTRLFTHDFLRKTACDFHHFLKLKSCDFTPDLIGLCRRYCTELNLPDEIFNIAGDFIIKTSPKFKVKDSTVVLPNYEGRIMAFIMYALKVLFSLDGATEYEFTKYAQILNKNRHRKEHMFVWSDWFIYIEYRKLILKSVHFPTKFLLEPESSGSLNLFTDFLQQKYFIKEQCELSVLTEITKKFLSELIQSNEEINMQFLYSSTPFRSYTEELLLKEDVVVNGERLHEDLLRDFSNDRLDFLTNSQQYLHEISPEGKVITKLTNANSNQKFKYMKPPAKKQPDCTKTWQETFQSQKKDALNLDDLIHKILDKQLQNKTSELSSTIALGQSPIKLPYGKKTVADLKTKVGRDAKGRFCSKKSEDAKPLETFKPVKRRPWFVSSWASNPNLEECKYNPSLKFQVLSEQKEKKKNKKRKRRRTSISSNEDDSEDYKVYFLPHYEYWVNVKDVSGSMSELKWKKFEKTLPRTFQWLLNECALIIEQDPKDLFLEFVSVELYINYIYLNNIPVVNEKGDNYGKLSKLITKVKNNW